MDHQCYDHHRGNMVCKMLCILSQNCIFLSTDSVCYTCHMCKPVFLWCNNCQHLRPRVVTHSESVRVYTRFKLLPSFIYACQFVWDYVLLKATLRKYSLFNYLLNLWPSNSCSPSHYCVYCKVSSPLWGTKYLKRRYEKNSLSDCNESA